jgi:PAS domain S-box-containing protein
MEGTQARRVGSYRQQQCWLCCFVSLLHVPALLFLATFSLPALAADAVQQPKNVLVLYSFSARETFDALQPLETAVRSGVSTPVNFHVEYLESQRFGTHNFEQGLSETLREAYASQKLDLVIAVSYPALRFAAEFRDRMFPGVPIVFTSVAPGRIQGQKLWTGVTGITVPADVPGTLDLALRLSPDTKNVAVVAGGSEFETYWLRATIEELQHHADRLKVIELVGLSTDQLLQKVSALPEHTIIFFGLIPQDSAHLVIGTYDVLGAIGQRFPTYCVHKYCLDHGAIGGSYADSDEQGVRGGELAARILLGEKPEDIPVIHGVKVRPQVDWRQLRRWNIAESALPAGTLVLYRQPTVWGRYEQYIIAGIVLIVVQALLIAGLLWQRSRRRRAEVTLRESERRFQVMADTTPSLVWMCDNGGKVTYINDRRINFTGRDPKAGFGDAWTTYIHPDDLQSVQTANVRALEVRQSYSKEYRLLRKDGEYRWMFDIASPRRDGAGVFVGFIGAAIDVTDQKLAREALEKISGKLIDAQDEERARIARELHDDFSQRLAVQCIELVQLRANLPQSEIGERARALKILTGTKEISAEMRALSHQLHSSRLDLVGLGPALSGLCEEITTSSLEVRFTEPESPLHLARSVELCLFRVAQEALRNVVKHSHANSAHVELSKDARGISLRISDTGRGFNHDVRNPGEGIGLISMSERLRLAGGTLSVRSEFMQGTEILAEVPLWTSAEEEQATTLRMKS